MTTDDPDHQPRGASAAFRQNLGGEWQLAPSVSEAWRFRRLHAETRQEVGAFARTAWIPARVPGSVHADLLRAGLIPDPNEGLASLEAEWVSARQWVYRRTFRVELPDSARLHLCFGGSDYGGDVFLDGELLGTLAGPHTPVRFDVSGLDRGAEHLLAVVLREPPPEAGQLGRTSETRTLKPRYGYWWDFATRLIHVGLWQDVTLEADAGTAVLDLFARAELDADLRRATVRVDVDLGGDTTVPVTVTLTHPDGRQDETRTTTRSATFELQDPEVWWPAGLGAQPLYRVRASVPGGASIERRLGIRTARLVHNAASQERGARPYTLEINGKALYARGFNMVPVDMIPGRDGVAERERALAEYALAAHANLLRFNGVAPIASDTMLDACDELGLLVWQEMPLTSSGTDNVPPTSPEFLAHLDRDLPALVRRLRNHPSVVLLGAGNELTDERRRPADETHPTIRRIQDHITALDGTRPFLPTSPSGPEYDLSVDAATGRPEDLHDVHGPWHYRGVHDSYRSHVLSRALAHSEFGCQAASRETTLRRYLTDGSPWPMDDTNPQVVHHGEWWLMRHRITEVFGPVDDLGTYVLLTQAAQGDVLRHALGWNRSRRGECSLALIWQLGEPWPNAHNTSLIDYDLKPKLAYYRCREANAPVALHLGLPGPVGEGNLTAAPQVLADRPGSGELTLTLHSLTGMTLQHETRSITWPASGRPFDVTLPEEPALLRAELLGEDGVLLARAEHWVARDQPQPFAALVGMPRTRLTLEQRDGRLVIRNAGVHIAPWVSLEAPSDVLETFSDSGFNLLPGEERKVKVRLRGRDGGLLAAPLTVRALNAAPVAFAWETP